MGAQLAGERCTVRVDLTLELAVVPCQLLQLDDVTRAAFEPVPGGDQLAVLAGLAGQLPGAAGVVPRAWLRQLDV